MYQNYSFYARLASHLILHNLEEKQTKNSLDHMIKCVQDITVLLIFNEFMFIDAGLLAFIELTTYIHRHGLFVRLSKAILFLHVIPDILGCFLSPQISRK